MPKTPSTAAIDRALMGIGGLASKSVKLSAAEKTELEALVKRGAKSGKLGMADRARLIWLIRKAGPESIPDLRIPPQVKKLLKLKRNGNPEAAKTIREAPKVDPLDRLEKLGALRGRPLSDAQFVAQRDLLAADPHIASFRGDADADPLDRLMKVAQLQEAEILTPEQSARITEQILEAL